jgi:TPR repeat protein
MRELRAGRESEALLLYLLAAGEGYSIAHYNAAWMLARNKGTGSSGVSGLAITASATALKYKKHTLALQLLQIVSAMQPAHAWASLLEGDLHRRGSGTQRNLTASAICYERGALAGNALAMERLAVQMMHGSGVRQDDKRAVQLLKLALACAGREGSGMRGLAVLVKKAELVLRLALLRFTGLLRSLLSGRWIARLLKRGGGSNEPPAGKQEEQQPRKVEQKQEQEQEQAQVQVQEQKQEQEDADKSSPPKATTAAKGKPMPLGLSHLLARAMEGSAHKDKQRE